MYRRHVRARIRLYVKRARRFLLHRVLHADDPPHRLALAVAIGVFVMITPTVGIQSLLTVVLAWLLGANKLIGLPVLWISNPVTIVPMYYGCYRVGVLLTGADGVDPAWWQDLAHPPAGWTPGVTFYWSRFMEVATPMWVGCLVVAAVAAPICYVITYRLIRFYRLRRWGQLVPPVPDPPASPTLKWPPHRPGKSGDNRTRLTNGHGKGTRNRSRTRTSSAT
jgi:uncharacterized protein (DUF2062 family)